MDDQAGDNDRVIISGGFGPIGSGEEETLGALTSSEIYTPGTRMFTRASASMSRARQGHTALLLDEAISSGYLRITSDMGLLASESYSLAKGGSPASVGAIDMAKYEGVKTVYSPRFVLDGERTTLLNVINGNENAADITLRLRATTGGEIACKTYYVAGNAQIKGNLTDVFQNPDLKDIEGWIEVTSSQDKIVGIVTFIGRESKYLGSYELSGTPLPRFIFPLVSENNDFVTELSFLNSGAEEASLTLELWNLDGMVEAPSKTVSLAAGANLHDTLFGFFGIKTLDTGNVRVVSNGSVFGICEIRARSGRFITPVSAIGY
jgi:hypothetical protein